MTRIPKEIIERLEKKLRAVNALRPLPKTAVKKLRQQMQLEMTYNSNAIEGNSLTLKETYLVIHEGITIKGKPLKDHLEAKDHQDALQYLYDLIDHDKKHTISEMLIRSLHQLVVQDTDREWAGRYRSSQVVIAGAKHDPPDASEVPLLMRDLILWVKKNHGKTHPVELAAMLHHKLANIHPFFDGNGRTSRLAMNVILMHEGYPLVVILKNDRKKYYRVLERADLGDYQPLLLFMAQAVERSLNIYLKVLTPSGGQKEKYILLSVAAKGIPYSMEYLGLLVRQGKLEGHKEGRNWLVSKEAVERYVKGRKRRK
jgi:Fic family protein